MTSTAATYHRPATSVRAWGRALGTAASLPEHIVTCGCGLEVKSTRPLEEETGFLFNVGWRAENGRLRCPECVEGIRRRVVTGSKGDLHTLRYVGGAWRCTCKGFTHWGHCKHAAKLTDKDDAVLADAHQYVDETDPGETIHAHEFVAWLGEPMSLEDAQQALAMALDGYRRVCLECEGRGGHVLGVSGWDEPHFESERCAHCDGEGYLEPPYLAPLVATLPVAAE